MIHAYHVIFAAYGFWLPNDPRGSWSDFVGAWELVRFGKATRTQSRRSTAADPHDEALRIAAKKALKYPPAHFDGVQARSIGMAFGDLAAKSAVAVWACSILPEHVHMVIGRHNYDVEYIVNLMKGEATRQLIKDGVHPFGALTRTKSGRPPKAWAVGEWKVFLDSDFDVRRAVQYVEENPGKEGLAPQKWKFVMPIGKWRTRD